MSKTSPISPRLPAVILAGGLSRRMGSPKSALLLGSRPMLTRIVARLRPQVESIALNLNSEPTDAVSLGLPVVADTVPGFLGPLAGVLAAMRHAATASSQASHVLVVPTDTPFFPTDLVARLAEAMTVRQQIAVAASAGQMHPLFALWPVALADALEIWLSSDPKRRVRAFIERHPSVTVDFPLVATAKGAFDPFFNVNTPGDLNEAEEWLSLFEDRNA
ncbi:MULTISPECIES: molybdenum cofactor guanylyltransferase MobA [unclassified Ensifer]|uniref:molybdenum cofactor guanylyltransferase MobA n=1 Tax=unclassified Ensifer TaxID=2633371 RepID=UPI0008139B2E|nr:MULTISPECIES: molybdenum cofactor guanylyltransferase MobA [unclassified Ensifer]OCP10246.1 molybdenum cofactor guanylyltransferase MobA [Ensifer sp. LC13]OCP11242.1 molybdenum cofactor guanylyltransferase MobA [Ensifer sp. LC11]OCP14729.1 molybdenum cofactor guanylyltransferase MobA [Ensifer sp. LC14]OCP33204.1 molybdenum cofactor guanylyltransferase MobA [Ensifer sp. LC499]